MVNHFVYMNGSRGCMPDNTGTCDTEKDAIDCLLNVFEGCISEVEQAVMVLSLEKDGIYYFDNAGEAGAEYCEVTEESGENPEHYEEFTRQYEATQKDDTVGITMRRVALVEEDSSPTHFAVFAFGAYHATYVAVGYEPNPYHRVDICDMLEVAAGWLADNAPGAFSEPDYAEARADYAKRHGEALEGLSEHDDGVRELAEADHTYTESGWLLSHEWTIVSEDMERDALLTWIRNA